MNRSVCLSKFSPLAVLAVLGVMSSCGNPKPEPEVLARGKAVYSRHLSCVTCHLSAGQGMPDAVPALRKNPNVVADDVDRLIKVVLHGMVGPYEVNGRSYNAHMAGLGDQLADDEVADVLTYIRNTWGNEASPVTVEQVRSVKTAYADRNRPWTDAELRGQATVTEVEVDESDAIAWGETLYNGAAQCASCHGTDGLGVEGAYPPLAGTKWVTGDHERLIKIALHGVGGEMEVLGETYSNEMPGQGALLNDREMAATLTYVRQAWGNNASPIYPDQVAKLREKHADRHEPWPASVLAAVDNRSPLTNVRYRRVDLAVAGKDIELNTPEFDALPVLSEGSMESGFIDLKQIEGVNDKDTPFAVIIEADFEVPFEDEYDFAREGGGSGMLVVNDDVVAGFPDIKPKDWRWNRGKKLMSPGTHRVKIYYAKHSGWRNMMISARGESVPRTTWAWTPGQTKAVQLSDPAYILVPKQEQPIVLRARFQGQGNLGITVGHPLRVNYAYDLGRSQLTNAWQGDFVNAAALWRGRNDDRLTPLGTGALALTQRPVLAVLDPAQPTWPDPTEPKQTPAGYESLGHAKVDGLPVIYSRFGDVVIRDATLPIAGSEGESAKLQRELTATSATADDRLYALVAEGDRIDDLGGGVFRVDGTYRVALRSEATPVSVIQQGGRALLIVSATWESLSIDLPEWVLDQTSLEPQALGQRAVWAWEYQWEK